MRKTVLVLLLSLPGAAQTPWDDTMNQGEEAMKASAYRSALQLFGSICSEEALAKLPRTRVALCLQNLAVANHALFQYETAVPLYSRAIAIWETTTGYDEFFVTTVHNLGRLYLERAEWEKAQPLLEKAAHLAEAAFGPGARHTANCQIQVAVAWGEGGRTADALKLMDQAIISLRKLYPTGHPELAHALARKGQLLFFVGQDSDAIPLLQKAAEMFRASLGESHPEYASAIVRLATVYRRQEQAARAMPLFRKAIRIYEQTYGPTHPWLAAPLRELAMVELADGRRSIARRYLERALMIGRSTMGPESLEVAVNEAYLARLEMAENRMVSAEALLLHALKVEHLAYPNPNVNVGVLHFALAVVCQRQHRFTEAQAHWDEAAAQYQAVGQAGSREFAGMKHDYRQAQKGFRRQ